VKQLLIAIPFYNRTRLLVHCLATLAALKGRNRAQFSIYLDVGFDAKAANLIPDRLPEASVFHMSGRGGASGVMHKMISDHAQCAEPNSRMLLLDADMIVRTDLIDTILDIPLRHDMLVSVYNSNLHLPHHSSAARFLHKSRLGATGTLWTTELAQFVVNNVPAQTHYDDRFCEFLNQERTLMCCTSISHVQHLGIAGSNNGYFGKLDHGLNYTPDGPEQLIAISEVFSELMSNQSCYLGKPKPLSGE